MKPSHLPRCGGGPSGPVAGTGLMISALGLGLLVGAPSTAQAQGARIYEETRVLQTYPFSEANPVPILVRDRRLYPYHSFEGYSVSTEPREWTVVTLENDYIQVFVLPEVGGKVWGAVVKEGGHEFIYRNEVMKFRNIALRGPWTSGGIEFNFGVIGHGPATATPVDYLLRENPDGSVSCVVGSMDLPSRTHWRVEIRLSPGRSTFETRVTWFNPTPLEQPYYSWMTAAAFARDDLEMSMPGNAYLQHSGKVEPWPVDPEGRYLPVYVNNRFGSHKSYHVVGELTEFFGGYYHDADFGFGHWARHEEMPGQKLWLWALSREGGVWEELLTDTDGQYVEFQAGRLFVQYSPGAHLNPITQASFPPQSSSHWEETWFPLEGTGGLTEASRDGAMRISLDGERLTVVVNAFRAVVDTLRVRSGTELVGLEAVELAPLVPFQANLAIVPGEPFQVSLPVLGLHHSSASRDRRLSRPFETDPEAWSSQPEVDRWTFQARELMRARRYAEAKDMFQTILGEEGWNREANLGMGELAYREGRLRQGLAHANRVLELDAYDARANFLAGILYRALDRPADARDALGWAARSTEYRAAAFGQLAGIMIEKGDWSEGERYARLALDYDRRNVPAWRALALIGRRTRKHPLAEEALRELLRIDPLHHFVRGERYLAAGEGRMDMEPAAAALLESLGGEFPGQSLLEVAVLYLEMGSPEDARELLAAALGDGTEWKIPAHPSPGRREGAEPEAGTAPLLRAWYAWLRDDASLLENPPTPGLVFPFRSESVPVLQWATQRSGEWVWQYLLALNLWGLGRGDEAADLMEALGEAPDYGPAYVARAHLLREMRGVHPEEDLRRGVTLNPETRILHLHLIRHLQEEGAWGEALAALDQAASRFPGDFNLDLLRARALLHLGRPSEAVKALATTQVLPSENARESHALYEQAHILAALDALDAGAPRSPVDAREHLNAALLWPERLGQGRPYQPEERLVRFLLGVVEEALGNQEAADGAFQAVVQGTPLPDSLSFRFDSLTLNHPLDLLALPALEALGRRQELEALARATSSATPLHRFAIRFAGSLAWGSEPGGSVARRLSEEFPLLFQGLEGEMLLRALALPGLPGPGRAGRGEGHP